MLDKASINRRYKARDQFYACVAKGTANEDAKNPGSLHQKTQAIIRTNKLLADLKKRFNKNSKPEDLVGLINKLEPKLESYKALNGKDHERSISLCKPQFIKYYMKMNESSHKTAVLLLSIAKRMMQRKPA